MMKKNLLEYKGYHAKVELDMEDKIFVGTVIGIDDSLNFHGSSVSELKKVFENSIDNYLEMCAQIGKEPNKEYKGSFNVRIGSELHKQVELASEENGITLNQYIINALKSSLQENKNTEKIIMCMPYEIIKKWNYNNDDSKYQSGILANVSLDSEVSLVQ